MCIKICAECKWFRKPNMTEYCDHPKNITIDPVYGHNTQKVCPGAMRTGAEQNAFKKFIIEWTFSRGECGPNGKWYEPKELEQAECV